MNIKECILKYMPLSISAHNSQPFKLSGNDTNFEIIVQQRRHLPVADPHHRDLQIGLGALLTTLKIGLSKEGMAIQNIKLNNVLEISHHDFCIASFEVAIHKNSTDLLFEEMYRRFSYRGKFKTIVSTPEQVNMADNLKLKFLSSNQDKKSIGKTFDRVNAKFLTSEGYIEELYSWLRFDTSHPQFYKDGLNVESMGLGKFEGLGASCVLKPSIFRMLAAIGIAQTVTAETSIIESASAIVAIVGTDPSPISIGEGFMKGWLKLTSLNLFGAPLSLLTEDADSLNTMKTMFNLKPNEQIYNILRVGPLPEGYKIPVRARLTKEELYV